MYNFIKAHALTVALLLLQFFALPSVHASPDWALSDLVVVNGSANLTQGGLRLTPDASGRVYLTLEVGALDLDRYSLVHIDIESELPLQRFLLWQTVAQGDQLFQFNVAAPVDGGDELVVDMAANPTWEGDAVMVGLGLFLPGRREVVLRDFRVHRPGMAYDFRLLMEEWTSHQPWKHTDSNFYPGTTAYRTGVPPVPLFAGLLGLALVAYVLQLLLRGRLRAFDWRVAGGAALLMWILVDLLWLARLGGRVQETVDTRMGKTVEERLLVTDDGPVVRFVNDVRPLITERDARVFIVTSSDFAGMVSSYYLTPLNTFWRRFGPELPAARWVKQGDFLLFVRPTQVVFDPERNIVHFPNKAEVAVEALHISAEGGLLRVM